MTEKEKKKRTSSLFVLVIGGGGTESGGAMADMWGDLLEVHDEAAAAKKTEAELKKFTVDEVRSQHDSLSTCKRARRREKTKTTKQHSADATPVVLEEKKKKKKKKKPHPSFCVPPL